MKMNLFKSKRFVLTLTLTMCCVAFSVLILGLAIAFNKTPNKKNASAQYIYGNNSIVKLEVIEEITLEDDTIEKLQPKIKVTSTGTRGEFGALVKVTSQNVVFDYTLDNTKHSFATMGKDITIDDGNDIGGGGSYTSIYNVKQLEAFRDDVKKGNNYEGQKLKLQADIDMSGVEWTSVGYSCTLNFNNTYHVQCQFSGNFDGNGYAISNLQDAPLFGNVVNGSITNLYLKNVQGNYKTSFDYYGCIVNLAENSTIENCKVDSDTTIYVSGGGSSSSRQNRSMYMEKSFGGIVGCAYNCNITNCEARVNVEANFNEGASLGGIVGKFDSDNDSFGTVSKCLFEGKLTASGSGLFAFSMAGIVANPGFKAKIEDCVVKADFDSTNIEFYSDYSYGKEGWTFQVIVCKTKNIGVIAGKTLCRCLEWQADGGISESGGSYPIIRTDKYFIADEQGTEYVTWIKGSRPIFVYRTEETKRTLNTTCSNNYVVRNGNLIAA